MGVADVSNVQRSERQGRAVGNCTQTRYIMYEPCEQVIRTRVHGGESMAEAIPGQHRFEVVHLPREEIHTILWHPRTWIQIPQTIVVSEIQTSSAVVSTCICMCLCVYLYHIETGLFYWW